VRRRALLAGLALATALAGSARAQTGEVVDLPTRPGVQLRIMALRPSAEPAAVVVLLSGGPGRIGIQDNGSLRTEGNFLIRSRGLFVQQGFATVLVDVPNDRRDLNRGFRESAEHATDLGAVLAWARRSFAGKTVWLVGTSRGTHSAANAAVRLSGEQAPDGVVLTATILETSSFDPTNARPIQDMGMERLSLPVLAVHHEHDGCQVCPPWRLPELMGKLPPGSKLLKYNGGNTVGPACEAFSYHGFNGIEEQVVADIAAWIGRPR
jgi:pimeloyl-ACP methyl ester carboxylesterase